DLTWTDASSDETGFKIERCAGIGCSNFAEIASVGPDVQAYQNSGLTPDVTYRYQVRAYSAAGSSNPSNIATASTSLPSPPTSLFAVVANATEIDLTWNDQASNEDGFSIERCDGVGCSSFVEIAQVASNVVAYANTGLTTGETYSYRV